MDLPEKRTEVKGVTRARRDSRSYPMETRYKKSERVNFVENASHRSKVGSTSQQEASVELKFSPHPAGDDEVLQHAARCSTVRVVTADRVPVSTGTPRLHDINK